MSSYYSRIACAECGDDAVSYSDSETAAWFATHECKGVKNG